MLYRRDMNRSSKNNNDITKKENIYLELFLIFLINSLRENIISPLKIEIETNLRLDIHTKNISNNEGKNSELKISVNFTAFLNTPTIKIFYYDFNIKNEITRYLERNFYDLTAMAVTDARTYIEMKLLANEKYGLNLKNNYLPIGSLGQSLDLLFIMRNLNNFVENYSYDLNMQEFTENKSCLSSSIKHLNTLNIKSIMSSIKQHGQGVVSTTINSTYKFLTKKIHLFCQFLFDDLLRGILVKECKWYAKNKNTTSVQNIYPYVRSVQFIKDIRRLGEILFYFLFF